MVTGPRLAFLVQKVFWFVRLFVELTILASRHPMLDKMSAYIIACPYLQIRTRLTALSKRPDEDGTGEVEVTSNDRSVVMQRNTECDSNIYMTGTT